MKQRVSFVSKRDVGDGGARAEKCAVAAANAAADLLRE